jgi:CRP-like cAMP-binding protein
MGGSFGERALIRNEDRAASIVCKNPCTFATLSRNDFSHVLGIHKKKIMREQISFFKEFRIFSKLRNNTVERISYYMEERKFIRNQNIYTENKSGVDGVYFIKSGEFEVYK